MRFLTCGADGILVELADLDETLRVFSALQNAVKPTVRRAANVADATESALNSVFAGVKQLIPAAHTIYVSFDPLFSRRTSLISAIRALNVAVDVRRHSRIVEIPVIYDGEDLADVADALGISSDQVVSRHCDSDWSVAFVGFAPGFAYLTGGDPIFDVPRRKVPRLSVPAGAVGLAGTFSGVYPRVSSGGWQLLGHTETSMWDERANPPALLQPGDTVRFASVRDCAVAAPASAPCVSVSPDSDVQADVVGVHVSDSAESDTGAPGHPASSSVAALEVIRPGLLTTFQDDGRTAASMGVTGSGAADRGSFHLANALVGNPPGMAALEITGGGVSVRACGNVVVAVTGAPADIVITGARQSQPNRDRTVIAMQEAALLRDGDVLSIAPPARGLRNYLSVRGGFDVPLTLGSAATDTMSGIGPCPVAAKQRLAVRDSRPVCDCGVGLPRPWPSALPSPGIVTELDVRLGPRDDWFTAAGLSTFLTRIWTVTAQSNRVGLRLAGEVPLERSNTCELASEATPAGAIEVPTSGQPVIFLRDQPVTGGYPVIAVLESESLDVAGQLPPGAQIRFHVASDLTATRPTPLNTQSAPYTKELR